MKINNLYWTIAGVISLFKALLHTIGGQMDLVNPLLKSSVTLQTRSELVGVWHMVTILLFATAGVMLYFGIKKQKIATNVNIGLKMFKITDKRVK